MKIQDAVAAFNENLNRIRLRKNERASTLIPLDISGIVDEYCRFIYALTKCRKVAEEEYAKIIGRIDVLTRGAETDVAEIRRKVDALPIMTGTPIVATDGDSPQKCADQLRKTLAFFSQAFTATIKNIREKISQDVEELKNFKVVLFGRTKVGKSTVREALTRGDGASIGRGGQSTTIDINEYDWYNLKVFDTPGILSVRDTNVDSRTLIGDEERKAKDLLSRSDIAIFMFASDNIEPKELEYLKEIAAVGKTVLILLNVKADISDYRMFKLRKKDRELTPEAQAGHISRINQVLDTPADVLPIHAQAAFFSRAKDNREVKAFFDKFGVTHDELYELSKFGEIRNFLVNNILRQGCRIRCTTQWEYFIAYARDFARQNRAPVEVLKERIERVREQILRADRKIEALMRNFDQSLGRRILNLAQDRIDTYDFASDCIEYDYSKSSIKSRWEDKLEALKDIPDTVMNEFAEGLKEIMTELERNVEFEINCDSGFAGYDIQTDLSGLFKAGGIISGIAGTIAAFAAFWWNPAGWIALGLGILSAAFGWLAGLFKSKTTKIRELQEKLDESLGSCCGNIESQLREHCNNNLFPKIRNQMKTVENAQSDLLNLCSDFLSLNDRLSGEIDACKTYLTERVNQL